MGLCETHKIPSNHPKKNARLGILFYAQPHTMEIRRRGGAWGARPA